MSQFIELQARGIPLKGDDIDTDRIIPARFLRCVTFDGLGEQVFADDRAAMMGEHPFDLPRYKEARILVVNKNFGCGSSREHAPQAIIRWGIKAIIGESFAEIFFGNCTANGVPCLTAPADVVNKLQEIITLEPESEINLSLVDKTLRCGELNAGLNIDEGARQMIVEGSWDTCGQLLQNLEEIRTTAARLPYLTGSFR